MQGNFSPETLEVFNALASQHPWVGNFDMSEYSYDFTRCIRPDGTTFGTSGKCTAPNKIAPVSEAGSGNAEADKLERQARAIMSGGRRHSRAMQEVANRLMEEAKKRREQSV